jgi:hypothetical protein
LVFFLFGLFFFFPLGYLLLFQILLSWPASWPTSPVSLVTATELYVGWCMMISTHFWGLMKSAGMMLLYMVTTTCCCWSYCMYATVAVDQSSNHSVVYPVFKVGFPLIPSFAEKSSHLNSLQVVSLSCTPQFYWGWHVMCGEIPSSYKDFSS